MYWGSLSGSGQHSTHDNWFVTYLHVFLVCVCCVCVYVCVCVRVSYQCQIVGDCESCQHIHEIRTRSSAVVYVSRIPLTVSLILGALIPHVLLVPVIAEVENAELSGLLVHNFLP